MTPLISLALVVALLVLAIRFPPWVLLVWTITCEMNDATGTASWLRSVGLEGYVQWARLPLLVAAGVSFFKIRRDRRRGVVSRRVFQLAQGLGFLCLWILLGSALKGEQLQSLPGFMTYAGVPAGLIALAYAQHRAARRLFVVLLLWQLGIATLLVLAPEGPLSFLAARNYPNSDAGLMGTVDEYVGGIARLGEQTRLFAQFYNPHAFGLYALIGTVVGGGIVFTCRRLPQRLVGVALLALGIFGWTVTVPRGATVGLALGCVFVLLRGLRRGGRTGLAALLSLVALAAAALLVLPGSDLLGLLGFWHDDVGIMNRQVAASLALAHIARSPFLGATSSELANDPLMAHQLFLYFAEANGILAGLVCLGLLASTMVWMLFPPSAFRRRAEGQRDGMTFGQQNVSVILGWIVVVMGITNNFGASMLYWTSWAVACWPWNFLADRRAASRTPAAESLAVTESPPGLSEAP